MKSAIKYSVIILLLAAAMPLMVYAGSSNVAATDASATPTPTPSNNTIQTFAPFFNSIFGIRIFPGADPVGTYTVNVPTPLTTGIVTGHMNMNRLGVSPNHATVYLSDPAPVYSNVANLGNVATHKPIGSYIATTDNNGYYEIDNVTLGTYGVYYRYSSFELSSPSEMYAGSVTLTAAVPHAVADLRTPV